MNRLIMSKDNVVMSPDKRRGTSVEEFRRLVQNHVPRLHLHEVLIIVVVEYKQRPGLVHVLVHIDNYTNEH